MVERKSLGVSKATSPSERIFLWQMFACSHTKADVADQTAVSPGHRKLIPGEPAEAQRRLTWK